MDEISAAELRALASRVFGREITVEQAEAYRPRLPTFAWAVDRLQAFDDKLGDLGPATVYRPGEIGSDDHEGG